MAPPGARIARRQRTPTDAPARKRHDPVDRPITGYLAVTAMRLLSNLPLPALHALGSGLGRLMAWIPNTTRHHTRVNLALCLPDESPTRRRTLERRSLQHLARAAFELPRLWATDRHGIGTLVRKVHGQEYLDAALASGRGLLLASAHVGAWEFLGLWFSTCHTSVGLYQRPHIKQLNECMLTGRTRFGGRMLESSAASLRQLIQALRRDECVWMMADQVPVKGAGVWAPFFGRPALTATLLPRLVTTTDAAVVWAFAERLPRGRGYDIHILPCDDEVRSPDLERAVTAMNRDAERLIRQRPEQYLWRYRRLRRTPDGSRSPYK